MPMETGPQFYELYNSDGTELPVSERGAVRITRGNPLPFESRSKVDCYVG